MTDRFSTAPVNPAPFHTTGERRTEFDDSKWLRDWHRRQGEALAMTDLDAIYCESLNDEPRALIEYKHFSPRQLVETNALRQFRNLANFALLPAYIVFYNHLPDFIVRPFNDIAVDQIGGSGDRKWSERDFVTWLHRLRGLELPACWPRCEEGKR